MKSLLCLTTGAAPVLLAALLAGTSSAQRSTGIDQLPPAVAAQVNATSLSIRAGPAVDHVLYDQPSDGRLWALGRSWKASFGADGVQYFPRVGAQHERSFPHQLSPESVTVGGQALAFDREVTASRDADRVELDRGTFVETYDLGMLSVEQSFVFNSLPRAGDLVVQLRTSGDVQPADTDDGVELRSVSGRVTYSRATAIDARGHRLQATTHVENGSVVIRVAAEYLATATLPLVVDPIVLNPIYPDNSQEDTFSMDTAYDQFNQVWLVVWEQVYSGSDHDVYAKMYDNSGALVGSAMVDFTSDLWSAPRCACLQQAHQFLVVSGVTASTSTYKLVRGRTVQANGTIITQGSQFTISDSSVGDKIRPDVGGDPYLGTAYWLVAWEHDINNAIPVPDHRIEYQIVNTNSQTVIGTPVRLSATPFEEGYPSVSKSDDTTQWLIAWQRQDQLTHGDIWAAHVSWSGNLVDGPFAVATGTSFDAPPCASSPIHNTQLSVITFHRGVNNRDIMVAAIDGPTVLQTIDLSTLENSGFASSDQIEPSVDCDGEHFLVSYSEYVTAALYYEIWVSELALSGSTLSLVQSHIQPQPGLGLSQRNSQVAAARTLTGTLAHRYLVVYDFRENDTDHDLGGRFVDGIGGGGWGILCTGDNAGTTCPCGNQGATGHGCANSVQPQGAALTVSSGTASTQNDTLHLQVQQVPGSASCLFFQGTSMGAGALFGDGLRCATGTTIRLANKTASASGVATYPQGADPVISVKGLVPVAGGVRSYQVWYRNAGAFCTPSTFNLSNGVVVNWSH